MGNTDGKRDWLSYSTSDESPADNPRGELHELRIRQIALEMRNEELEEANRCLDEERRRISRFMNNVPVGHITLNPEGRILELNLTASDILLKPRRDLVNRSLYTLLGENSSKVLYTHLRAVLKSNEAHVCNLRLSSKGGRTRYVQLRSRRNTLDDEGQTCHGAIIDITKTRMAREALSEAKELNERIVQSVGESLIVVDHRLRVLSVNTRFVEVFGIQAKNAEGASLLELKTGLDQVSELRKRAESLAGRRRSFPPIEVSVDVPGNGSRELSVEAKTLASPHASSKHTLIIVRDLTEQKHTERRMRRLLRELEEINGQLSNYTSVVSHDLRAPLQIANNYVSYLKEDLAGSLPEKQQEYLEGIEASLGLAGEMVNGLLTLSRIRRSDLVCKRLYLGPFIRKVVDQVAAESDAEISMYSKWPSIVTEPMLLQQIVMNLLDNAVKYNDSEKKIVELTWQELPDGIIRLAIKDNGPGIPPAQRERIFKAFTRLHSADSVQGSGLGLSIVRTAAGRLGGSVSLDSKIGEGTTFFLHLPRNPHDAT